MLGALKIRVMDESIFLAWRGKRGCEKESMAGFLDRARHDTARRRQETSIQLPVSIKAHHDRVSRKAKDACRHSKPIQPAALTEGRGHHADHCNDAV